MTFSVFPSKNRQKRAEAVSQDVAAQPLLGVMIVVALFCGRTGVTVFFATLGHFLDAGFGLRV